MLTLQGVFSALRERERTGRGQRLETSLAQALSVYDMTHWLPGMTGELRTGDSPFVPYSIARTSDGVWLQFAQNGAALFETFFRLIDLDPGMSYLESMGAGGTDPAELRELRARILERLAQKTWAEWQAAFEGERNIAVEPFWGPGEALEHPQLVHMGDSRERPDPERGPTRQLGPLVDLKGSPAVETSPAARAGVAGRARLVWRSPPAAGRERGARGGGDPGRRHRAGVRHVDRDALQHHPARRPGCAGDQDRAARRRSDATHRAPDQSQDDPGQAERRGRPQAG